MKKKALSLFLAGLMTISAMSGCGRASDKDNLQKGVDQADTEAATDDKALASGQEKELPSLNILNDKYRTTYEIFVYSFYDSDGDGVGDINGVTKMLDYINDGDDTTDTDLGCNEIWLMPISPSTTYHKYDVTNYKDIDPEYGTLEDFDNLVSECHKRGINVIIDTVFNHSSSQHPWFLEATGYLKEHPGLEFGADAGESGDTLALTQALSECPFLAYYNFSNEKQQGYEPVAGTDYFYEARFWSEMPDLNLDSDALRQELSDITHFWTDRGVDGFRLDATTYYYTGQDQKNIEFLKWLKDDNKDAYFVGEAWANAATYQKYYESGIDSFFDFEFAGSEGIIASTVRGTSPASRFAEALEKSEAAIRGSYDTAIDAPFYTNHDMARSAGYYTGTGGEDKLKLAYGLSLIMGGNSFIYYGEELGMKGSGKDENKRAPMYWTAGEADASEEALPAFMDNVSAGMCKGPKAMDYFKMKYPALDVQTTDPYSIYNYFKKAIRLRNTYPVVARGTTTMVKDLSDQDICAFTRSVTDEEAKNYLESADPETVTGSDASADFGPLSLLFVINTSDEEKTVDITGTDTTKNYQELSYQLNTGETVSSLADGKLTISPYGVAVLTSDK
ncbi:MAG: alpha-amylase [Butyrivibrio sp.]|uniref:alpha-amylase family glycosyl hydrolase n=1 Tax=Butyrivibrio sp. TaxID=28121 RepID=UPI001B76E221|nr:alpha-amylase family glycosyl hydrolase [Butyrivibrio sp.]MBP3784165.1 alpha-amylase [Butyrivibrio sp.]